MIKILFVIESLKAGGAEKVMVDLVNHMDQTKFNITVQTVWPCKAEEYLVPGIHYKAMYSTKNDANVLRYRAETETGLAYRLHIIDDYDIECAYLEMGPTKVVSSSSNRRAKKLAWVHCDLMKAVDDPVAFAAKSKSRYAKFDQIICVSQTAKESFDQIFNHCFDSIVLYNVIDDVAIRKKAESVQLEKQPRRFTVLSVGRLAAPKNYLRLLQTHKRMLDEGFEHDLWILGEGPERAMLEQYIEKNGMKDSVWMPGFIDNPYPYLRAADLLTCSSVYEGFSTFVAEAIVLGRPVLTTDVSGMREILGASE